MSYSIDIRQLDLDLHKTVSAPEVSILQTKVDTMMAQWDKRLATHKARASAAAGKYMAADLTIDAGARRDRLRSTLHATLSIDDQADWNVL